MDGLPQDARVSGDGAPGSCLPPGELLAAAVLPSCARTAKDTSMGTRLGPTLPLCACRASVLSWGELSVDGVVPHRVGWWWWWWEGSSFTL